MVVIEYLGRVRELVGRDEDRVALEGDSSAIGSLLARLQDQDEAIGALKMSWLRFSCNDQLVDADSMVRGGDRVSIFMAVAGG